MIDVQTDEQRGEPHRNRNTHGRVLVKELEEHRTAWLRIVVAVCRDAAVEAEPAAPPAAEPRVAPIDDLTHLRVIHIGEDDTGLNWS
ncbi:MAG TPA: hypothetical protein VHV30_00535 [Polyangiaceae bacterium]|jgi:hypothetical protein|nr:hypothetical protein [Polyangiaceae bacterium]